MNNWLLLFTASFLMAATTVFAQLDDAVPPEQVWLFSVGGSVHGTRAGHSGQFVLPQAPTCCSGYGAASSFGLGGGLFLRQEFTKHVRLMVRGGLLPLHGDFASSEQVLLSGQVPGTVQHELDVTMSMLAFDALVDFRVPGNIRLMAGITGGPASATFSTRERLVNPPTGTFENGSRLRAVQNDVELQGLPSFGVSPTIGIGYDIHLTANHRWTLTPEVLFTTGFNTVVEGLDWSTSVLRAGISLGFAVNAPRPPTPIERKKDVRIDTIVVRTAPDALDRIGMGEETYLGTDTIRTPDLITVLERFSRTDTSYQGTVPVLRAALAVRARESDGRVNSQFGITVTTQFVTEALPVLPVVFFDPGVATLASRYVRVGSTDGFREDAIVPRTPVVHHNVLNIIGSRMRRKATTTITLTGSADPTTEAGNCAVARARAESVQRYLTETWGIDATRIRIATTATCGPERPTRQQSEEGFSENRRVDISTDDMELLASVARRRFNEATSITPPQLEYDASGSDGQYVTDWTVEARTADSVLFQMQGTGKPGVSVHELSTVQAEALVNGNNVAVGLEMKGLRGSTATAKASIAVRKDTLSVELERLTLTLFDVASDKVGAIAEEQIRRFVETVPAGSTVIVRGYADMLGNAQFNRELSQRRAAAVCASIRKVIKRRVTIKCDEVSTGFPPGIESYRTPEERFLSRTVQIEVQRPRP
ncbi:MAG: hypothetical protein MUC47_06430 [Candidatus Kapabacteria bacterium]|nr:hypothetical protein [Candidatus Kapabacteria bacterium]